MPTRSEDWLAKVAEILRADTGDLRNLANIGGTDPATMYIGTSLDGADLRGQDLRGIRFTHLNVAKIRSDSNTIIDQDIPRKKAVDDTLEIDPLEFLGISAIILLRDPRLELEFRSRGTRRMPNVKFYGPHQENDFLRDSGVFPGPKFAIVEHNKKYGLANTLSPFEKTTITLVARRGNALPNTAQDVDIAFFAGPVVIVPIQAGPTGFPPLVSGVMADAIDVFIANWDMASRLKEQMPLSVFFRGHGNGSDPAGEAWCRILTRTQQTRTTALRGLRLTPEKYARQHRPTVDDVIFPELERVLIHQNDSKSKFPDAIALMNIDDSIETAPFAYVSAIHGILRRTGWKLKNAEFALSSHTPADLEISGKLHSFTVTIFDHIARAAMPRDIDYIPIRTVDLETISHIVVSEAATERVIVPQLSDRHELWVNCQDLYNFDPKRDSIWSLMSQQLRRVARAMDAVGRTQYLYLLIQTALRRKAVTNGDPWPLIEAVNEFEFERKFTLTCGAVRSINDAAYCTVRLIPNNPEKTRPEPAILSFQLWLEPSGPLIKDVQSGRRAKATASPD